MKSLRIMQYNQTQKVNKCINLFGFLLKRVSNLSSFPPDMAVPSPFRKEFLKKLPLSHTMRVDQLIPSFFFSLEMTNYIPLGIALQTQSVFSRRELLTCFHLLSLPSSWQTLFSNPLCQRVDNLVGCGVLGTGYYYADCPVCVGHYLLQIYSHIRSANRILQAAPSTSVAILIYSLFFFFCLMVLKFIRLAEIYFCKS